MGREDDLREGNQPGSTPESTSHGKRKLWVACDACRFRKVKCDREARLESGYPSCTNCAGNEMDCILTVNAPKKRMGKRMKMLHEQRGSGQSQQQTSATATPFPATLQVDALSEIESVQEDPALQTSGDSLGADNVLPMSPGFASLLEAVSHQTSSAERGDHKQEHDPAVQSLRNVEPASTVAPEQRPAGSGTSHAHSADIKNGVFAAIQSNTRARPNATSPLGNGDRFNPFTLPSPSSSGNTIGSAALSSNQGSPDSTTILASASFLSGNAISSNTALRSFQQKTPFDKSPSSTEMNQVGFVGGLLGIASLDKPMLDVCTHAYFNGMGSCIGFIRPEWYWPRYKTFFARYSGLVDNDRNASSDDPPLSELLLIAVACLGCGTTDFANKFDLQSDLFKHYCRLTKDRERLVRDGFDALESVVLMSDYVLDGKPKAPEDPMSAKGVYDVDILSHEGLVRLMMKLELNLEKPFGITLQGKDYVRQRLLFWTIFVYDAIRSEAGRKTPLIRDEDIGIQSRLMPPPGGEIRILFRDYFVDMANICRSVTSKITSIRSCSQGINPEDVIHILDALDHWYNQMHPMFQWDWQDSLHITGPQDTEDRVRRTFLIFLYLGQYLVLSYAIKEIGMSISSDSELQSTTIARIEAEVDVALEHQVMVCEHGTLFGIIRLHPGMMQSWSITWCSWTLQKMEEINANEVFGRVASAKASDAFNRYQNAALTFINAVATCDSNPDTPQIVQNLSDSLRKVSEERKTARLFFDML